MAQGGRSVVVHEAEATLGGGCRSAELTLPGFVHDVCSAIHPLAAGSPFFRSLPLADHGLEWVHPPLPLAHPLDDGSAAALHRSVEGTAAGLGEDADAYRRLAGPLARDWDAILEDILRPIVHRPRHPFALARFGLLALPSARFLAHRAFRGERARALFAGLGAHSFLPLSAPLTASFALMLGVSAHAVGWPLPRGGSQRIADALAAHLRSLGGAIVTGDRVRSLADLEPARATVLDVTPRQLER
ncbi:MAG: phytoene desaturase family protein, partial [Candidatus Limnocylindria bacterium]